MLLARKDIEGLWYLLFDLYTSHHQQMPHDPKQNNPKENSAQKQKNQRWNKLFWGWLLFWYILHRKRTLLHLAFHLIFTTRIVEYHYPLFGKGQHKLNDLVNISQMICGGVKMNSSQIFYLMISLLFHQITLQSELPWLLGLQQWLSFKLARV